jgi:hypothetical protein
VIVNPQIYERNRRIIRRSSALIIAGVLQKEQGCFDLLAPPILAPRNPESTE